MKSNPELLPTIFFDWIQQYTFNELNAEQQKHVLQYMTCEEYSEFAESSQQLNASRAHRKSDIKNKLMHRYDQHYSNRDTSLILSRQLVWKAASVILFITTCWFALKQFNAEKSLPTMIVQHDTIYLDKNIVAIPTNHIPDSTSQMHKTSPPSESQIPSKRVQSNKVLVHSTTNHIPKKIIPSYAESNSEQELHTISINEINNKPNAHKRNSMKDDSLEKNFRFVSL